MPSNKCIVRGCDSSVDVPKHQFPKIDEDFKVWVERTGNFLLKNMAKNDVIKKYLVCRKHFDVSCHSPGTNRLKFRSLPTLHLPIPITNLNIHNRPVASSDASKTGYDGQTSILTLGSTTGTVKETHPATSNDDLTSAFNLSLVPLTKINVHNLSDASNTSNDDLTSILSPGSIGGTVKETHPATSNDDLTLAFNLSSDISGIQNSNATVACQKKIPLKRNSRSSGILKTVSVTRKSHLTPTSRKLYIEAKKLQRKNERLNKTSSNYRARIKLAEKFVKDNDGFEILAEKVNSLTFKFILSQMRNQQKKPKGKRFTVDDKILALSIFKQSPKAYRYLSTIFSLPSRGTITKLLTNIPFETGINTHIIEHLKYQAQNLKTEDKYCTLIFDEMALDTNFQYNQHADIIYGFEDFGYSHRHFAIADHVLVFMLRGIKKKWKQPIAYYFCKGTTKTNYMVQCIKEVVKAVFTSGLQIIATVCDQGATNVSAINKLKKETSIYCQQNNIENKYEGLLIEGHEIVPIFDPPHLLKCIRNNLLTKDVFFKWNSDVPERASWSHILNLYYRDKANEIYDLRVLSKITENHVIPERIKKMKVSFASQIFSHTVAATMKLMNSYNYSEEENGTSKFILFMDKVFDSVNGSTLYSKDGKELRCAIKLGSPHISFWNEAIQVFQSMSFLEKSGKKSIPPCIKNWIVTLRSFKYLWYKLSNLNLKFLILRNINQDPLENFFGKIRSQGLRNINPTCWHFIQSFKSLLINNLTSIKSLGSNCEEDDSCGILTNIKKFLFHTPESSLYTDNEISTVLPFYDINCTLHTNSTQNMTLEYVAGYIAKTLFKTIKKCATCTQQLIGNDHANSLINARNYVSRKALHHPSTNFSKLITNILNMFTSVIHEIIYLPFLSKKLILLIELYIDFNCFTCEFHDIKNILRTKITNLYLFTVCKNVNRILCGNDRTNYKKDVVKQLARQTFIKKLKCKKK